MRRHVSYFLSMCPILLKPPSFSYNLCRDLMESRTIHNYSMSTTCPKSTIEEEQHYLGWLIDGEQRSVTGDGGIWFPFPSTYPFTRVPCNTYCTRGNAYYHDRLGGDWSSLRFLHFFWLSAWVILGQVTTSYVVGDRGLDGGLETERQSRPLARWTGSREKNEGEGTEYLQPT